MKDPLMSTNIGLGLGEQRYQGKVRDVYSLDDRVIMVATDRISAFDHILPRGIPYKGEILNRIAANMLCKTSDIVPNWLKAVPHPNISIGLKCDPIKLEMVVRKYLVGHSWRIYKKGGRQICGVEMPDGLNENDPFPDPIITPATKAEEGHDEDISEKEILERGIVDGKVFEKLKEYSLALFNRGTEIAKDRGLILVDTKYEFGIYKNEIVLIDEIHTPDSSRYFYLEGYEERQRSGKPQRHLSKEFVREWLISEGFQGLEGQHMPIMSDEVVSRISSRYQELYKTLIGEEFTPQDADEVKDSILRYLETNGVQKENY